jgi:hypothetical protein
MRPMRNKRIPGNRIDVFTTVTGGLLKELSKELKLEPPYVRVDMAIKATPTHIEVPAYHSA